MSRLLSASQTTLSICVVGKLTGRLIRDSDENAGAATVSMPIWGFSCRNNLTTLVNVGEARNSSCDNFNKFTALLFLMSDWHM